MSGRADLHRPRLLRLDRRGIAAFEFVMIAPFMILAVFGIIEFAAAIRMQMGVNQAARTVANLIVQQSDVTTSQLNDYFTAGQYCYSYNVGTFSMSATAVNYSAGSATGSVAWNASTASSKYVTAWGNVTALSSGLEAKSGNTIPGGDATIVVQAKAVFTVPVSFGPIAPSYTLTSTVFARPRVSFQIKLN
jgi:Flp pilus assembly protein TadG